MTRLLRARSSDGALDATSIAATAALLKAGRLVALPTETVYGLGANALDAAAAASIYTAKGRPSFNPLIVHVLDMEHARPLCADIPDVAARLAAAFWPGPLTLVVPRSSLVPNVVTGGGETVALRAPAHPAMRAVLEACGVPVAAPSANLSGSVSPTTAAHVLAGLDGRIDAVLDDGPCSVGIESTVVDCTVVPIRVLRPGAITASQLAAVVGAVDSSRIDNQDAGVRASPGLLTRHYAPNGTVVMVAANELGDALAALPDSARVGIICVHDSPYADARVVAREVLGANAEDAARMLYAALHAMDAAQCSHVLLEAPPASADWEAVADRLRRAAAPSDAPTSG
jgi:L-threonylcarbamoyladenylate synthase